MKQKWLHSCAWALGLILALSACSKAFSDMATDDPRERYSFSDNANTTLAIGTHRIREGERTVRMDASTLAYVVNPETVSSLVDGVRIFLEYSSVSVEKLPEFCTEAIYVHWASALDVGAVSGTALSALNSDPVGIETDWITSLEDGFLTLHYSVHASGSVQHTFTLAPGANAGEFFLLHDAHGDQGGSLTDGIICFPVASFLPDTGGKTVTLSLDYLNLEHTRSRLTIDYRSPE